MSKQVIDVKAGWLGDDTQDSPIVEEGAVAIDAKFQVLCEKHAAPFKAKRYNEHAATFMFMHALTEHLFSAREPQSSDEIAAAFKGVTQSGKAMCCLLGDEVVEKILAKTPTATGDKSLDEEIALTLEPTAGRYHRMPKVRESVEVREGGEMLWLTLGPIDDELLSDMPKSRRERAGDDGNLLAVISSGHPHGDVTVLDLKRVKTERDAARWFEEALKAKAWLHKQ